MGEAAWSALLTAVISARLMTVPWTVPLPPGLARQTPRLQQSSAKILDSVPEIFSALIHTVRAGRWQAL